MWEIWQRVRQDLGDLEVFGENLYGVHSIEYQKLPAFFFIFAIRHGETWLSWEEVAFYSELLALPLVPVVGEGVFAEMELKNRVLQSAASESAFGGACEGVVVRAVHSFEEADFSQNVLKYVRANHIQTDEHWTRHWRKATLAY
jgi:RNA ligase